MHVSSDKGAIPLSKTEPQLISYQQARDLVAKAFKDTLSEAEITTTLNNSIIIKMPF